jgi:hypothetical protein
LRAESKRPGHREAAGAFTNNITSEA